ncbi:MAG: VanZ family protein [Gemmataceae bacterium]
MTKAFSWLAKVGPRPRMALWLLYLASWSLALLTPRPIEVAQAVLPPETSFYYGKSLHVCAYAGLTVLTGWLLVCHRCRWLLLLGVSLHAFATEYLQNYVPLRTGSWRDVGLDHIGIVLGFALTRTWWWRE